MAQDRVQLPDLVNTVMNHWVLYKAGISLTIWSRRDKASEGLRPIDLVGMSSKITPREEIETAEDLYEYCNWFCN
jgi:hypothetical protein